MELNQLSVISFTVYNYQNNIYVKKDNLEKMGVSGLVKENEHTTQAQMTNKT